MVETILEYNQGFVDRKEYLPFETDKYPAQKLAIITCMDARLMELLPAALGLKNGDAHIIKTAGAMVTEPYGSEVRSVLVGVYTMGVREVLVIGHSDCGMKGLNSEIMLNAMSEGGISAEAVAAARREGGEPEGWLFGFSCCEDSVRRSVNVLRSHPLLPENVSISGLIIDPATGALRCVSHKE